MYDIDLFVCVIAGLSGCAALWWKVFRGDIRDHMAPIDYLDAGHGLVLLGGRQETSQKEVRGLNWPNGDASSRCC